MMLNEQLFIYLNNKEMGLQYSVIISVLHL